MRGPDTPRTNLAVEMGKSVNDLTIVLDLSAELERRVTELQAILEHIGNAYGCLPMGKQRATPAVRLAVNRWIAYRDSRANE